MKPSSRQQEQNTRAWPAKKARRRAAFDPGTFKKYSWTTWRLRFTRARAVKVQSEQIDVGSKGEKYFVFFSATNPLTQRRRVLIKIHQVFHTKSAVWSSPCLTEFLYAARVVIECRGLRAYVVLKKPTTRRNFPFTYDPEKCFLSLRFFLFFTKKRWSSMLSTR